VLRIDPDRVDLRVFERLVRDAEPLPARERSAELAEALALWRGAALADLLFEPAFAKEAARLEELRLAVLEARIDADLELGGNAELIGELEALVAAHPLRERLRGQLILALYRSGRQAEALEVYRGTRRLLANELGLEPSPALRELERAILRQEPSLAVAVPPPVSADESPTARRRWIGYGALAGGALLAAGGIAVALAATQGGDSSKQASSTQQALQQTVSTQRTFTHRQSTRRVSHESGHSSRPHHRRTHATVSPNLVARTRTRRVRSNRPVSVATKTTTQASASQTLVRTTPPGRSGSAKRQSHPVSSVVRITDGFLLDAADPQMWDVTSTGTAVDVNQGNGRLEMTIHADATPAEGWPNYSVYYTTTCSFAGDFDASIDYSLVDWPTANGTSVGLDLVFPNDELFMVRESFSSGEEVYAGVSGNPRYWRSSPTTDPEGAVRFKRVNDLITAYYRAHAQWDAFESIRDAGAVRIRLMLLASRPEFAAASGSEFAHKDVTVAFENFAVEAPPPSCP